MTPAEMIESADIVRKLGAGLGEDGKVREAPIVDVLFHGLGTGREGGVAAAHSVLWDVRGDFDVLIGYMDNEDSDVETIAAALARLKRRLEVVDELLFVIIQGEWAAALPAFARAARPAKPEGPPGR